MHWQLTDDVQVLAHRSLAEPNRNGEMFESQLGISNTCVLMYTMLPLHISYINY